MTATPATTRRFSSRRLRREARTVEVMVHMHCRAMHGPGAVPCDDCAALLEYAMDRIEACRFADSKPTCARCTVHCYRPTMREQIRAVMRYSGPRMISSHPYLAVRHLLDRHKTPVTD